MADSKMNIPYDAMARSQHTYAVHTRVGDPDLIVYVKEYCPDSFFKGATEINVRFRPYDREDKRPGLISNYDDDGSGIVNLARMKAPSTENGEGISRNAMGHSIARWRMDNNTYRNKIYAKRAGRASCSAYFEGPYTAAGLVIPDPEDMPEVGDARIRFTHNDQHGYSEELAILLDRMPCVLSEGRPGSKKLKKGDVPVRVFDEHTISTLLAHYEEFARVMFPPEFHAQTTINLYENPKVGEGIVSQRTVRKKTLLELLRTSPHVQRSWEKKTLDMGVYTATIEMFKLDKEKRSCVDPDIDEGFPHYNRGGYALIASEGWVTADISLAELYGLKVHPTSQLWFVAFINLERKDKTNKSDIEKMPIPTTVKVAFHPCKEYDTFLEKVRVERPMGQRGFAKEEKKAKVVSDDDDGKTTASYSSFESLASSVLPPPPAPPSGYEGSDTVPDIRVPVIPVDDDISLGLPKWISDMIGTATNLTMTCDAAGMYTFNYKRAIHDIDRDTIALALAVNDVCRRRGISVASHVDIVWHIAASNQHLVHEKLRAHAEDHAVLICVRPVSRA